MKKTSMKKRIYVLFAIFLGFALLLCCRLFYLQIIKGAYYKEKASQQQLQEKTVSAMRGNIYDRNMTMLAQSATAETVIINPKMVLKKEKEELKKSGVSENTEKIQKVCTELLEKDENWLRETLDKYPNRQSIIIKRKVEKDVSNQIREMEIEGIEFTEDSKRYYPYGSFASHIIGFTGADNQGLEGIERTLDSVLSGTAGRIQTAKDARSITMPYEYESYEEAQNGQNVVLTIDEVIQHYVEKHLRTAYLDNNPLAGASAIVINPKTGEILAMAVQPDYDLNNYNEITEEKVKAYLETLSGDKYAEELSIARQKQRRNKAVSDSYEPGSTFKAIVASAALEEGVVSVNDTFFCPGGKQVATSYIHCWKTAGHGAETFYEGVMNSCNPVFMAVGERLGADKFIEYFKAFGLNSKTGFILPGEQSGIFHKRANFNAVELATASFGQGFNVTPLQMVSAFSAVVNGGKLMKPQIVKAYTDQNGNITKNFEPIMVRRVISEQTSATMRDILESVVAKGTGKGAYVKGYRIGGKTGTSEKGIRSEKKKIASFIGFAPANDPEVLCLLMIDEPSGSLNMGGQIAAPVVGKILEDTLRYLGYEPEYSEEESAGIDITVPELREKSVSQAQNSAHSAGLKVSVKGSGQTVINQIPKPGARLHKNAIVILYTDSNVSQSSITVPSVIGLGIGAAQSALSSAGLNIKVTGGGASGTTNPNVVAVSQSPAAGSSVEAGSIIYVDFIDKDVD